MESFTSAAVWLGAAYMAAYCVRQVENIIKNHITSEELSIGEMELDLCFIFSPNFLSSEEVCCWKNDCRCLARCDTFSILSF